MYGWQSMDGWGPSSRQSKYMNAINRMRLVYMALLLRCCAYLMASSRLPPSISSSRKPTVCLLSSTMTPRCLTKQGSVPPAALWMRRRFCSSSLVSAKDSSSKTSSQLYIGGGRWVDKAITIQTLHSSPS